MSFDMKSPQMLKKTQEWFAGIITQPIDEDNNSSLTTPSGASLEDEAFEYIKPSPTLRPKQRIEIYNQQYWWRLLNVLHDIFPLVTRLFGYHDFNRSIAIPYLEKHPPSHWSLNLLGAHLSTWIKENYMQSDKKLVYDAAKIDYAFYDSFLAKELPPIEIQGSLSSQELTALFSTILYLQPSIHFFELDYDIFSFREDFLKEEPEYWIEHDFPPLRHAPACYILYRTPHGDPYYCEISQAECTFLRQFISGNSFEAACQWLENQAVEMYEEAEKYLHTWIQGWIIRKWLSLEKLQSE